MSSAVTIAPSIVRSSLETMLDSIRLRDEQPKDLPPALPIRPTSRGRLPSSRRPAVGNLKLERNSSEKLRNGSVILNRKEEVEMPRGDEEVVPGSGIFGSRKMVKVGRPEESPYTKMTKPEICGKKGQVDDGDDSETAAVTLPSAIALDDKSGCGDTIEYVLKKNLQVWCWIQGARWDLGQVQSVSGDNVKVLLHDGNFFSVFGESLLPANPHFLDGVDDLIQLSYLNEPSVLHNIKYRYSHDFIYTKAGPVLVAVNPFKEVPLYGSSCVSAYKQNLTDSPHVFAIADNAYNTMMSDGVNQSIIISGESGAGKTESAKYAMRYLSDLGGGDGIEEEVLQSNAILEAFGNAKTLMNDNSSRFGKIIEINFSAVGKVSGAKIQTFLLEKSRVVQRAAGERSYHVFYQLCAGAAPSLKEKLNLKASHEYEYLKQSNCLTINNVDDAKRFHALLEALDVIEISKKDQNNMFSTLAAVLWLGNIGFSIIDNENHVEVIVGEGVTNSAKLMGCEVPDLMLALSTRKIKAGKDSIVQKLTLQQAIDSRDALAKSIYYSLFEWLVEQINKSLAVGKCCTGRSISILDIFGFESFHKNGFEQFCINYANERLQQLFNRHLFKLEQEEYSQDGIDWTEVKFLDNTDCLNLFEKKPLGLISLLEEESTFPKANDLTFANKLRQHLSDNNCFKRERGYAFRISHYAGEVLYHSSGFLERNRDTLHADLIQLLFSCSHNLLKLFASNIMQPDNESSLCQQSSTVDLRKQSVVEKFKGQLFKLMQRLEITSPHFVRCIKPNNKQLPGMYEHDLVLKQLRCCGVLEVVRISRSGYPTRIRHQLFAERYGILIKNSSSHDALSLSVAILQQFNVHPEMYRVGYTKLFFRTGQIAVLEDARKQILQGIVCVQKNIRGYHARQYYQQMKNSIILLQSCVRGQKLRHEFEVLIWRWRMAILIQKNVRRHIAMTRFDYQQKDAVVLQSVIRGLLVRKKFNKWKMQEMTILDDVKVNKNLERSLLQHAELSTSYVSEMSNKLPQVCQTVDELHRRALRAEAALREKEEENATLQQRLKQYEARWSEYEVRMKSIEQAWQKQLTSLQSTLSTARRRLITDGLANQHGQVDISPTNHNYDSEDTVSAVPQTPEDTDRWSSDARVKNGDAEFIVEVKSEQSSSMLNPDEELQTLKVRFSTWKKDYSSRLRETKAELHKYGNAADKVSKKWWIRRSTR